MRDCPQFADDRGASSRIGPGLRQELGDSHPQAGFHDAWQVGSVRRRRASSEALSNNVYQVQAVREGRVRAGRPLIGAVLAKRQRLSLRFIHLLGTVAHAVSANCYALNLTVRLIVAHFHCKRFTT